MPRTTTVTCGLCGTEHDGGGGFPRCDCPECGRDTPHTRGRRLP